MSEQDRNGPVEDQEVTLYKNLVSRSKEILETTRDKTADAFSRSMEKAKEELVQTGQSSREQAERLKGYFQRDFSRAGQSVKHFREAFQPGRVGSGIQSLFSELLASLGSTFSDWSARMEENVTYTTGELSSPGTLMCKKCQGKMHFKKTGRIPPCPKCASTQFKKTF